MHTSSEGYRKYCISVGRQSKILPIIKIGFKEKIKFFAEYPEYDSPTPLFHEEQPQLKEMYLGSTPEGVILKVITHIRGKHGLGSFASVV